MQTRFEIEPDYADALRAAGLADFDALFNATPSGPPTSKHKHRETVPIEFDVNGKRQRFFLKRVFKVPAQHAWRPRLRGKPGYSQPAREWDNIKMMRDAGLPVMKRVAVGERRQFGIPMQAFILVEDVGMQWTLENWLVPGFPRPPGYRDIDSQQLWNNFGSLRRRLDAANIAWPDLHLKHVFADAIDHPSQPGQLWRFALIDVERASMARSKTINQAIDEPENGSVNVRSSIRNGKWPSCAKLPLPDSFVHPLAVSMHWQNDIKATVQDRALLNSIGIQSVECAFRLTDAQNLSKPGLQEHRDRLRVIAKDQNGQEVALYLKRYRRPPLREQFRRIREADRSHSTGYREYNSARVLLASGIPVAPAVAVGEEMLGWWEKRSFVVLMGVEGESLESLARNWKRNPESLPTFYERWELIKRVAWLVSRMHGENCFHRDLYLSHIFLSRNAKGEIVVQLIDLARMLHSPILKHRWEIKDLAALCYSVPTGLLTRTDQLRFLKHMAFAYFVQKTAHSKSDPFIVELRQALLAAIQKINRRVARMARHDAKRATRFAQLEPSR